MNKKSLLIVEGKSDCAVVNGLCALYGITLDTEPESANSIHELKKALPTLLKSTNIYRKLWIIIDADKNVASAWQSIKDIMLRSGKYQLSPALPLPVDGAIIKPIDDEDLTVGVWIMPNNTDAGMLEDFMLDIIQPDDPLLAKATDIVAELDSNRDHYPGLFKAVHKSKAAIHTWLAWHDKPGESLPTAVQKRLFDKDSDLCRRFASWLEKLNSGD